MNKRRVILVVMDSLGIGELPDAADFGDKGADTFGHIADTEGENFKIPNLQKTGFCNIPGAAGGRFKIDNPKGAFAKSLELSKGKDTITGHWEIAGIETKEPFKTYPDGFPPEFIKAFEEKIGRKVIGNYPESGTVIIDKLGPEHEKTGNPIVYTSADSVFQIAANTDVIPLEELYNMCRIAREMLHGDWACGRVIARPYIIENGQRVRTSDRHDYAVTPPEKTLLNYIEDAGQTVYSVGKIKDVFNGSGITEAVHTDSNMDGVDKTIDAINKDFEGLIFTNLVDFDSKYGHRRNPSGYGQAIMDFDRRLPEIIGAMKPEDMLILTADHGNDPVHTGFNHTREYTPVVFLGKNIKEGTYAGIRDTFADTGKTIADYLGVEADIIGTSFLKEISRKDITK